MKISKSFLIVAIFITVLMVPYGISSRALADAFNGSADGLWTDLSSIVLNENGSPFWDNHSLDGSNKNVGFQIASLAGDPKPDQFWSRGGAVDNNVSFTNDGYQKNAALLVEIAGNSSGNALYAFNKANRDETFLIFGGSDSPVSSTTVTIPYADYGFKLVGSGGDFYSVTSMDDDPDRSSNFAFFRNSALSDTWWIGIEDLPQPINKERIGDYNDMIVRFSSDPVPEPATMVLLGLGLIGLAALARKKLKK